MEQKFSEKSHPPSLRSLPAFGSAFGDQGYGAKRRKNPFSKGFVSVQSGKREVNRVLFFFVGFGFLRGENNLCGFVRHRRI